MARKKDIETTVREIRRKTRKKYSAEEKIRIVLEGLRGEGTVAELCRREGIHPNMYYKWSKGFLIPGSGQSASAWRYPARGRQPGSAVHAHRERTTQAVGG